MRTAPEILKEDMYKTDDLVTPSVVIAAMKAYAKEAIKIFADKATAECEWHRGRMTGLALVDKQSILSLINEVK